MPRRDPRLRDRWAQDLSEERNARDLLEQSGRKDLSRDRGSRDVAEDPGRLELEKLGAKPTVPAVQKVPTSISGGILTKPAKQRPRRTHSEGQELE
jgi:hypothetical protein